MMVLADFGAMLDTGLDIIIVLRGLNISLIFWY